MIKCGDGFSTLAGLEFSRLAPNESSRWDGYDGCPLFTAGFHQAEDEHEEGKHALGWQVPIIDPKPVAMVGHHYECIGGLFVRTVDSDQRPRRTTRDGFLRVCWIDSLFL